MQNETDGSVTVTETKAVDAGTGVTVKELKGHLEITPTYAKESEALALETERDP